MFISGLILVKNNARTIRYALDSIKKYTDEIVVIDSGSTDSTLDIAGNYTDRIYYRKWDNHYGNQKNFGISKCRGKWIFILDSDELVGENFGQVLHFLNNRYRVMALPRYHIVDVAKMLYITSRPHYFDWQGRFIRNDGATYYNNKPIHEKLVNYRPRLKCNMANIFHLVFVIQDYAARKNKVDYYNLQSPGSGYPQMYLFEDYLYRTSRAKEMPEAHILEMLRHDGELFSYPEHNSFIAEIKQKYRYYAHALLTKSRASLGI